MSDGAGRGIVCIRWGATVGSTLPVIEIGRTESASRAGDDAAELLNSVPFPNRIREERLKKLITTVPELTKRVQESPDPGPFGSQKYSAAESRLRRMENGEIVPEPEEIRVLSAVLQVEPAQLLYPEVGAEDRVKWAGLDRFRDVDPDDLEDARTLAAAVRWIREVKNISYSRIEQACGISPSSFHRLEQAERTLDKLSKPLKAQIARLFTLESFDDVMTLARALRQAGTLDGALKLVALPVARIGRMVERLVALDTEFNTNMSREPAKVLPMVKIRHREAEATMARDIQLFRNQGSTDLPEAVREMAIKITEKAPPPVESPRPSKRPLPPSGDLETMSVRAPDGGVDATYVCARPQPMGLAAPLGLLRTMSSGNCRLVTGDEPRADDFVVIAILADTREAAG